MALVITTPTWHNPLLKSYATGLLAAILADSQPMPYPPQWTTQATLKLTTLCLHTSRTTSSTNGRDQCWARHVAMRGAIYYTLRGTRSEIGVTSWVILNRCAMVGGLSCAPRIPVLFQWNSSGIPPLFHWSSLEFHWNFVVL